MVPELPPTFSIPLEASPSGKIVEPGMQFAGPEPYLYVLEPVWNATWGKWLVWNLPTLSAWLLVGVVVLGLWVLWRVMRRPRQVGRMYCRGCNHQLAKPQLRLNERQRAVWADAEAKCPECGRRHRRGPVRGRSLWVRLIVSWLVVPPVGLACALVLLLMLGFHTPRSWAGVTWPTEGMEKIFGSWALERRLPEVVSQSYRLLKIDPATGAVRPLMFVDEFVRPGSDFVTPDGKYVILPQENGRRLRVVETLNGAARSYGFDESAGMTLVSYVLQFPSDGRSALVHRSVEGASKSVNELLRFDPADGKMVLLGRVEVSDGPLKTVAIMGARFEVKETDRGLVWLHLNEQSDTTSSKQEMVVRWRAGDKELQRIETSANRTLKFEISLDGLYCDVIDYGARSNTVFSLETGETVEKVLPRPAANNRGMGPRLTHGGPGSVQVLAQSAPRNVVGTLKLHSNAWTAAGSLDGRYAAGVAERDVAPSWMRQLLGLAALRRPEVAIWDFSKLLDAETGEAIVPAGTSKP